MNLIQSIKLRWVTWVWKHTPNCAQMARLASQRLDRTLPLKLRLKIRLHFLICVWCKRYFQHVEFIHNNAPRIPDSADQRPRHGLSPEAKQRIKRRLQEAPNS